jgi:hypothetical protein
VYIFFILTITEPPFCLFLTYYFCNLVLDGHYSWSKSMALAAAGTSPPASPSIKYNNTLRRSRAKSRSIVPRSVSPSQINLNVLTNIGHSLVPNIGHFLFRASVILSYEHPVFSVPNIWTTFPTNIRCFIFRSSGFFIPNIGLFQSNWSPKRTSPTDVRKKKQGRKGSPPNQSLRFLSHILVRLMELINRI